MEISTFSIPENSVTWKRAADTIGTDWEAVARELAGQDVERLGQLARQMRRVTRTGSRRLYVPRSWGAEED